MLKKKGRESGKNESFLQLLTQQADGMIDKFFAKEEG